MHATYIMEDDRKGGRGRVMGIDEMKWRALALSMRISRSLWRINIIIY